jgi:hypothetical protein
MTTTPSSPYAFEADPDVAAFLADGGYASADEWMADSDFVQRDGQWFRRPEDGFSDIPVDPEGAIEGAMESLALDDPS